MGSRTPFKGCFTNTKIDTNPSPTKFWIEQILVVRQFVILKVKYYGCTNFEGMKVLVYFLADYNESFDGKVLDPHFSEGFCPVARFKPTPEGWAFARYFALGFDKPIKK